MDAGASCLCCIPGAGTTKACPTSAVLKVLIGAGLHIDASSGHEVERALRAGVAPNLIQLTAQQAPADLKELVENGVLFNACSIAQHPIRIVPATPGERVPTGYLVVGHCCESGDVLTPAPGNPEALQPRVLPYSRNPSHLDWASESVSCSR